MTDETDEEARRKARRAAVDAAWEEYWREEEARVTRLLGEAGDDRRA